jgi:hypothetical protein
VSLPSLAVGNSMIDGNVPEIDKNPLRIYTGMYIKYMNIKSDDDTFYAEIYFWFRYDAKIVGTGLFDLEKDIHILEFVNGNIQEIIIDEGYLIGDEYYVNGRLKGSFNFISDYRDYPFDTLRLPVMIEHSYLTSDEIVFKADSISLNRTKTHTGSNTYSEAIQLGDLRILGTEYDESLSIYNSDFGDVDASINSQYSRLTFSLLLERDYVSFIFKAFIPLVIVMALAYLAFYIPASALELAGGLTATSLLAAIAFQWTINSGLPNVSGLILVDKVFYLAYLLIMATMLQTVYTYNLENSDAEVDVHVKRVRLSNRLEMLGRILYPTIFIGYLLYTVFTYTLDI